MFGFIVLFSAFMFNMGAEVQKSGDLDRIVKEVKEIKIENGSAINSITNR